MKLRDPHGWLSTVLVAFVASAVLMVAALVAVGDPGSKDDNRSKNRVFNEEYPLESGGALEVDVDDMDIHVKTGSGGGCSVEVFAGGSDREKAREYFENMQFDARLEQNTLVIESRGSRHSWSFWKGFRNVHVWAVVSIPRQTNVIVETEDGDVRVDDVNGIARIYTEDGDLEISEIRGASIDIRTEDGDVTAAALKADDIRVVTEDGDVKIDRIKGGKVRLSSEDGDISVSRIEANDTSVETSDGDIEIAVGGARLDLRCEDGDVIVTLLTSIEADLQTDDGDIKLVIPKTLDADLDLEGDRVSVRHKLAIKGTVSNDRITGSINAGGSLIRVKTDDGSISVSEG